MQFIAFGNFFLIFAPIDLTFVNLLLTIVRRGEAVEIGDVLDELMEERDMSQADLHRATGVSEALISDYIRGKKRAISKPTLLKLADGLGVTTDRLLGRDAGTVSYKDDRAAELCRGFDRLNEEGKKAVLEMLDFQLSKNAQ